MAGQVVSQRVVYSNETLNLGSKSVTTAGTQVQLSATSVPCYEVLMQVNASNTGSIYVGGASVDSSTGIVLIAPAAATSQPVDIVLSAQNLNQIWIDSDVNGEGVRFIYW